MVKQGAGDLSQAESRRKQWYQMCATVHAPGYKPTMHVERQGINGSPQLPNKSTSVVRTCAGSICSVSLKKKDNARRLSPSTPCVKYTATRKDMCMMRGIWASWDQRTTCQVFWLIMFRTLPSPMPAMAAVGPLLPTCSHAMTQLCPNNGVHRRRRSGTQRASSMAHAQLTHYER